MIGLVRNLLFRNRDWCWGIVTGKVMGNQVCALGPQPGEAPLLFLAGEKTRWAYVRGKPSRVPPATRWPRDISGRIGVEKPVLGLVSWKLGDGEVSVSVQFDNGWGWRGRRWGGAKGKQQSNNFASGLRSPNANQVSVLPSPTTW